MGFNEKTYKIPMNLIKEEYCDLPITNQLNRNTNFKFLNKYQALDSVKPK